MPRHVINMQPDTYAFDDQPLIHEGIWKAASAIANAPMQMAQIRMQQEDKATADAYKNRELTMREGQYAAEKAHWARAEDLDRDRIELEKNRYNSPEVAAERAARAREANASAAIAEYKNSPEQRAFELGAAGVAPDQPKPLSMYDQAFAPRQASPLRMPEPVDNSRQAQGYQVYKQKHAENMRRLDNPIMIADRNNEGQDRRLAESIASHERISGENAELRRQIERNKQLGLSRKALAHELNNPGLDPAKAKDLQDRMKAIDDELMGADAVAPVTAPTPGASRFNPQAMQDFLNQVKGLDL